ncbi:hypothetical protein X759_33475 [Mesorhizobium sp. LSHC420B00]|nr:hypothetical protein X759_33475 [Mesorhizobium sp. LSHC420B00]
MRETTPMRMAFKNYISWINYNDRIEGTIYF